MKQRDLTKPNVFIAFRLAAIGNMEIKYLKLLRDNPTRDSFVNEGMSLAEIDELEQLYNNGSPFPTCIKELLFLAGKYCIVLNSGNFKKMNELMRKSLNKVGFKFNINRPFLVVENWNDDYYIVFLDEDRNDPELNIVTQDWDDDLYDIDMGNHGSLSLLIEERVGRKLRGLPIY